MSRSERAERAERATAKLQAVLEGGPRDEMVAAECGVLDWLARSTAADVDRFIQPAFTLGYRGIEISGGDDFFDVNRPWIGAEVARLKAECPGLALDVRPWCVSIALADDDDLADHDHLGDIMPRPVPRLVECPAMPGDSGMLPPDVLRMVCCPRRVELASVSRAWRAALRPIVGPQVVEGRGWASWILPLPCAGGSNARGSNARAWVARGYPSDVLARVAIAWRRAPYDSIRGLGLAASERAAAERAAAERPVAERAASGRRPMRVGPCGADVELALETDPTDLHVVDLYETDVAHRVDLLARWPAGLEELHVHGDSQRWSGLVFDSWLRAIDLVGDKQSIRGQDSRFEMVWRARAAPDAPDAPTMPTPTPD